MHNVSFYMIFRKPPHAVQEPTLTLKATLVSSNECPPSKLIPVPDVALTLPELLKHTHLCAGIRQIGHEKARRTYELKTDKLVIKAPEDELCMGSGLFRRRSTTVENCLFCDAETVLSRMFHHGTPDNIFEPNLEK